MKSKSNKIIFSFLIISLVIIIIGYFLWAILIPIQDFSPMDKQETIRMQKELCFARPFYTILQRKSTHLCA